MKYTPPPNLGPLFDSPGESENRLKREFEEFHAANPHVFELFVRFARQVKARGFQKYSARTILERIRWHTDTETTRDDGFKLNDHHTPFYSRLVMSEFPDEFADFFEIRVQKSQEGDQ